MTLVTGELCKRVKDPTSQDLNKLDRGVLYLLGTLNQPLRLGCTMPPKVTVSIDAAFVNRDNHFWNMRYIWGGKFYHKFQGPEAQFQVKHRCGKYCSIRWYVYPTMASGFSISPRLQEIPNYQSCNTLLTKGQRSAAETRRSTAEVH